MKTICFTQYHHLHKKNNSEALLVLLNITIYIKNNSEALLVLLNITIYIKDQQ